MIERLVMIGGHLKLSRPLVTTISDVKIIPVMLKKGDGTLLVVENKKGLPFTMQRVFAVVGAPPGKVRGNHAHKECQQALVCVQGKCLVTYDDGVNKNEVVLSSPDSMLYLPAGIWASQSYLTEDTVLMVFADKPYDEDDYIRNYDAFLTYRGKDL